MSLYKIKKDNNLFLIKEKRQFLEKDVQKIIGENLEVLMGLSFVAYEFQVSGKRIDILAYDREVNAPVIIELKRDNDRGLFDQGMEYFNLLLDRDKKHVFLTTLSQKIGIPVNINSVDWGSSRVVFIGKKFTERQMRAVDFRGIPIELWDYNLYEDELFELSRVGLNKKVELDINSVSKSGNTLKKIKREFKEYDLDHFTQKAALETKELFYKLREEILKLGPDLRESFASKDYIGYKLGNKNVINVYLRSNKINIHFTRTEPKDLIDPENRVKYRKNSFNHYNQHISVVELYSFEDLEYIISLIRQAYKRTLNIK